MIIRSTNEVVVPEGVNIVINALLGTCFRVTITGPRNVAAPLNPSANQLMILRVIQGTMSSYSLTWDSVFKFSNDLPVPILSSGEGKFDILGFIYNATISKWLYIAEVKGF